MSITFSSEKKYNNSKKLGQVIVEFTAEWCGPCQDFKHTYEKLAEEFDHITFISIDIDEYEDWKDVKSVKQVPTFKFLNNGNSVGTIVGVNEKKIRNKLLSL